MTDYFIKGTSQENLLKIIANYLGKKGKIGDSVIINPNKNKDANNLVTSSNSDNQNQPVIDLSHISSFTHEEQKDLISIFIEDVKKNINKIKDSIKENNSEKVSFALHALKGMSGNIGATKFYNYLQLIQPQIKKSGKLPEDQQWFSHLEKLYQEIIDENNKLFG